MKYFTFMIYQMLFSLCVQVSGRQLYARDNLFYVSDSTEKVDHVTSREQCTARAGMLLHANAAIVNTTSVFKELHLTANTSYWLDGPAPTYLSTNSCLLLSNATTIMAVGCQQHHGYICEIDVSFSHTISATRSTDFRISYSSSINSKLFDHTTGLELQASYTYHYTPSATVTDWQVNDSQMYFSITKTVLTVHTKEQVLPAATRTFSNVPPTINQTSSVVDLHTPTTSRPTTSLDTDVQTLLFGNQNYTQLLCNRYCLSLSLSDILRLIRNTSTTETVTSNTVNDSFIVNAKETSKAKRKLTSATDSRTSSKAIGGFAVFIITIVPVFIILMDLPLLIKLWTYLKCSQRRSRFN